MTKAGCRSPFPHNAFSVGTSLSGWLRMMRANRGAEPSPSVGSGACGPGTILSGRPSHARWSWVPSIRASERTDLQSVVVRGRRIEDLAASVDID